MESVWGADGFEKTGFTWTFRFIYERKYAQENRGESYCSTW